MGTLHGIWRLQGAPGSQGLSTANAGVLRLVKTGAVQATAAPAPIRWSIFLREIPVSETLISAFTGFMTPSFYGTLSEACAERALQADAAHRADGVTVRGCPARD